MIRNLKALGLALVAVFAMSAMAAAAAQAEDADFAATEYPAHIVASNDGTQTFSSSIGTLTCVQSGESQPVDGTAILNEESSELTTEEIKYTNCHATVLKLPVTVHMNGCDFNFTAGTIIGAGEATGTVHIECPAEKEITITVFSNKTKHAEGVPGCVYHIPPQTPTSGHIIYKNITTGDGEHAVTVQAVNNVIHATRTAGALCTAANENNTYNGAFIAEATEEEGVTITGTP